MAAAVELKAHARPPEAAVDFDLRGRVGVRLLGAAPRERARVIDQLGPIEARLEREPDITVRFVDRIEHGPLTYVEWPDTAFDDESFLVLSGKGRVRAKARIPFEDVGGPCEIVCERGVAAVPHLVAIVNASALAKGVLPLHASAFVHRGRGILATGWAKGGKTEALLAFMAHGARYVGDEWVYLTPEGSMFGIPEPIRLWAWHLREQRALATAVRRTDLVRMRALDGVAGGAERAAPSRAGGPVGSLLRRAGPMVRRQANVRVPPARLFGAARLETEASIDQVVLMSSHDAPDVRVDDISGADVAARMAASLERERHALLEAYRQFRFAFPQRRSHLLERATTLEATLLRERLGARPAAWVRHPYPGEIEALYRPIAALAGTLEPEA
jgi:hypothetical protein